MVFHHIDCHRILQHRKRATAETMKENLTRTAGCRWYMRRCQSLAVDVLIRPPVTASSSCISHRGPVFQMNRYNVPTGVFGVSFYLRDGFLPNRATNVANDMKNTPMARYRMKPILTRVSRTFRVLNLGGEECLYRILCFRGAEIDWDAGNFGVSDHKLELQVDQGSFQGPNSIDSKATCHDKLPSRSFFQACVVVRVM